jgi:hypothetical protein
MTGHHSYNFRDTEVVYLLASDCTRISSRQHKVNIRAPAPSGLYWKTYLKIKVQKYHNLTNGYAHPASESL